MKKKISLILTVAFLAAITFMIVWIVFLQRDVFTLKISGNEVSREELLAAANQKRYEVASYFTDRGGGSVDAGFWEREVDGELPYEKLAQEAIEELKYFYAVYGLAKEKGYVEDSSYLALQKRWEEENQFRKEKIEKGEAVYGLSEYTLELYLEYEMDSIQKSYCDDLDNEGMEVTDADREQYYQEHEDFYQREDDRTLDYIKIPYSQEGMDEGQIKELKDCLTSVYKAMDSKHSLKELAEKEELVSPYLGHADVTAAQLRTYSRSISDILEYAWDLQAGESTAVLDENGALYLIECSGRSANDPVSMEEVRDSINKTLREERYDEIVEERAAKSSVEGDMESICLFLKKHLDTTNA